jgi:hypothetical protein
MKCIRWQVIVLCWLATCHADSLTTTQNVSVGIFPLGKVTVASTVPMSTGGVPFAPFTGMLPLSFRVRTSPTGGGRITAQATSDFTPRGGPSIASGDVRYTCGGASLGTPCSGSQVLSTGSQTTVLTIPAGACTGGGLNGCGAADPNSVTISFTLDNSPEYPTGNYSAQVTFTISAI